LMDDYYKEDGILTNFWNWLINYKENVKCCHCNILLFC
jgi:hypothetical protein